MRWSLPLGCSAYWRLPGKETFIMGLLSHGQRSTWMSRLVVVKNGALQVLALSICSRI